MTKKIISPAYSVAGGSTNFSAVQYDGNGFLGIQIFYTGFNKNDNKIRLQESIDGDQYVDSVDENGNNIEVTLSSSVTTDMINVSNFNADFIRVRFIEGTAGVGTISSIKFLMK